MPRSSHSATSYLSCNPTGSDRKSTRLNSSHEWISYAVFCLKKKKGYHLQTQCADRTYTILDSRDAIGGTWVFFFNATATTEIYTLSLHDALPICGEAAQAMGIGADGFRLSQLAGCVSAAAEYLLSDAEARQIIDRQVDSIRSNWEEVSETAQMTADERKYFWG